MNKQRINTRFVLWGLLLILVGCGVESDQSKSNLLEKWTDRDNPNDLNLGHNLIYDFKALPTSGKAAKEPWSASYWPHRMRGIAYRWQRKGVTSNLGRSTVLQMSPAQIALLSPAEKFDIFMGNYHFPLTEAEKNKKGFFTPGWVGMCHGWAVAAIIEPLPGHSVVMHNADGVAIKFYQDDIKALLTKSYAQPNNANIMLGSRSTDRDTNPGTLHVLLANHLGIRQQSFAIDRDKGRQVWNQPIQSYEYTYGEITPLTSRSWQARSRAAGTRYLVDVELTLTYVDEHAGGDVNPRPNKYRHLYLHYSLELGQDYQILGGEYYPKYWFETKVKRTGELKKVWGKQLWPDYVFQYVKTPPNSGVIPYYKVKEILNASLGL